MAQKAAKTASKNNAASLSTLHLLSAIFNALFILYRFLYHYSSTSRRSFILYTLFNGPALVIEWYLEKIGRGKKEDINSAGGLMEMMWDVVYVTWGCFVIVSIFGEKGWWCWAIIPVYGAYAAYTTATGMRSSMAGLGGAANDGAGAGEGMSKRQTKMEKRGADGKVRYR